MLTLNLLILSISYLHPSCKFTISKFTIRHTIYDIMPVSLLVFLSVRHRYRPLKKMTAKSTAWIKPLHDRFFLRTKKRVTDSHPTSCVVKIKVLPILVGCRARVEETLLKWFHVRINEKTCKIVVLDMHQPATKLV